MEWIDLNITRPEICQWVLCLCTKGGYWLGWRAHGGWYIKTRQGLEFFLNDDRTKDITIVYWLPIPELPKELTVKLFPDENEKSNQD